MYSMAPKQVTMPVSHVSPVGGYHLDGAVVGVKVSFLVDTGAAVTLLRKDTWDGVCGVSATPDLSPCLALRLVGVEGTALHTHGSAAIELDLCGRILTVVVVVSLLTSAGILGLDFLRRQEAFIDLSTERVRLRGCDVTFPLHTKYSSFPVVRRVAVRAARNLEMPARTEREVMACLDTPDIEGGTWIVEDSSETENCNGRLRYRSTQVAHDSRRVG